MESIRMPHLENIKKTNKIRINIITLFPIYNKMYNSNIKTNVGWTDVLNYFDFRFYGN